MRPMDTYHTHWTAQEDNDESVFPQNAGSANNRSWLELKWNMVIAAPGEYRVMCRAHMDDRNVQQEGIMLQWHFDITREECGTGSRMIWGSVRNIRGWNWLHVGNVTTEKPFTEVTCLVFKLNHTAWWKTNVDLDGIVFRRVPAKY